MMYRSYENEQYTRVPHEIDSDQIRLLSVRRNFLRLMIAMALAISAAITVQATAEEFDVEDGDVDALVNAINDANVNDEPDTIHLAENGLYTLTQEDNNSWGPNGFPKITSEITIEGNGSIIERNSGDETPEFRFFFLESGSGANLTLINLTLDNASAGHGGAIRNWGNTVTLIDCTISNSTATNNGGAIHTDSGGSVTVTGSTFTGNTAGRGGAINKHGSGGSVTITDCTFSNNSSDIDGGIYGKGGAVYIEASGSHTITGSTFTGNAGSQGGAIGHGSGSLTVVNCTISDNVAADTGGGVHGSPDITNCTITNNEAPLAGGIDSSSSTVSNSIIADNIGGDTIGSFDDAGYNVIGDGSGITEPTSMAGDPVLGPLADNGGPTMTHALLNGSPAIDAGDCNDGEVTEDQRGMPRPQGGGCDIGAFETDAVACSADLDGSGAVDIADLLSLLGAWGLCDGCTQDLDNSGAVDIADLLELLGAWGPCA